MYIQVRGGDFANPAETTFFMLLQKTDNSGAAASTASLPFAADQETTPPIQPLD